MKEIEKNDHYKILTVELPAGTSMPRHLATSDAYIIVESGNALLIFKGETYELNQGSNMTIPSREPHLLKVIRDFKAFVVLAKDAVIDFAA
ncbi:cupin domain-containing protein [Mucilaginibacter sp.]|jgi:quercetin dioxygenase-like cupin family protein|uniref:cupin domain-containing protein n=1 Tax=Mucilaginibacter sp. TaxID=1882438 RepID=UPI002C46CE09|nr:cupin domain-containing protein [Mucilaginibacter sp.]HTI58937.1 cupin domain-containing protein [Mucilaginibacter sp.]